MATLTRRRFLEGVLLPAAVGTLAGHAVGGMNPGDGAGASPEIIDTNVHLFDWPFRKLKYARTKDLVVKLRKHRITQAWAGSYEAMLHKNLDGVNARLAEECQANGDGRLIPIGAINPTLPDWEEDLRRCQEKYKMRGVRLYPSYHTYTLDRPEVARLLQAAQKRGLLVQVAIRMEDPRVHHPVTRTPVVDIAPLPDVLAAAPGAKVQLLNVMLGTASLRPATGRPVIDRPHVEFTRLIEKTQVRFDISHIEGQGGAGRLIAGDPDLSRPPLPVERLMFGSHAPFFPCESAVFKLFESPLGRPELEKVMRGNAERIIKG